MKLKQLLPYLLFVILVCVFLWRPIFKGEALLPGDYLAQMSPWNSVVQTSNPPPQWNPLQWDAIAQFYPWRVFYARSMHAGHLPLWNPHQFSGTPFLANGQSAVLYPPNLLFLMFNPITAFTIFAALHLFLAQVFMYWLLRELGCKEVGGIVGAICFAFSAFMVLWLELPTLISVAVWLPLVLLMIHRSVERKSVSYGMLAGGALSLAFLAGHLQIALYVALAAGFWWLWNMAEAWREEGGALALRRLIVPCAACLIIAGLVASAQVLPSLELAKNSPRTSAPSAEGYKWFTANAVQPYRLVTAFAPDFYGNPSKNTYFLLGMFDGHAGSAADYMEYGLYVGILPLLMALIGLGSVRKRRHVGFFAVLALLAIFAATGTIVNAPFYYHFPGFSAFGGPNRILLLYLFGVAGLAGFGIDYMLLRSSDTVKLLGKNMQKSRVLVLSAAILLSMFILVAMQYAKTFVASVGAQVSFADNMLVVYGLLAAAFVVCGAFLLGLMSKRTFSSIVIFFIVADLFAFGINYNPTCTRDKIYPETKLTTELIRLSKTSQRIAPINSDWSLFKTPKAILPPNAAMVYGLCDVQGYDSLYTKDYHSLMAKVEGVDPSPPENGNMVLVRRYPGEKSVAGLIVTREDLSRWTNNQPKSSVLKLLGVYDGIRIYGRGPVWLWSRQWPGMTSFTWEGSRGVMRNLMPEETIYTPPVRDGEPAWVARLNGRRLPIEKSIHGNLAVMATGPGVLSFSYEPFTFRLGLFLALLGVASLSFAGAHDAVKRRSAKQ